MGPAGSCHLPLGPLFPLPEPSLGWAPRSHCVFAPARVQGRPSWASALCPGRRAHFTLSPLHPRPVLGRPSFAQPLSLPQRRRSRGSQRGKRCRQPGTAEAVGSDPLGPDSRRPGELTSPALDTSVVKWKHSFDGRGRGAGAPLPLIRPRPPWPSSRPRSLETRTLLVLGGAHSRRTLAQTEGEGGGSPAPRAPGP